MDIIHHFIHLKVKPNLESYAAEKMERLTRKSFRADRVEFTYHLDGHDEIVELLVRGYGQTFRAKAKSHDFFESVDKVMGKISRQLVRQREKRKRGVNAAHSKSAKIRQLNPQLEWNPTEIRRAG